MALIPGLTVSQRPPLSRANSNPSSASEAEPDDRHATTPHRASPDSSRVHRGAQSNSPARKLSRKRSLLNLTTRTASIVSSTGQQSLPDGPGSSSPSPTSRPQPARKPSLKDSLEKPLPQTPPESGSATPPPAGKDDPGESPQLRRIESRIDSRASTMGSASPAASGLLMHSAHDQYNPDVGSSMSSLASSFKHDAKDDNRAGLTPRSNGPASGTPSPAIGQAGRPAGAAAAAPPGTAAQGSSTHLSGLMCNVHRTTGREPPPLVGATTTILGDKLYVFGGRILSRSRPAPLTADLYELDLISRHWTRLETGGDVPPPRYFHSMCLLGDTKMVCYGGMSPASNPTQTASTTDQQQQPEVSVMSDIYIYDVETRRWTYLPAQDAPQGRYAHCACILPSSASFSSSRAPLAALQHNPSSSNPNEGRIGINIDGSGGAEMVIVGGQDGANHYIEQISVFNLRSLKWTSTQPLGKSCGAYRSVAAPLLPSVTSKVGKTYPNGGSHRGDGTGASGEARETGSSMLIYSNYNFLDVKLELQIRSSDGTLVEKPMSGTYSPPGLRFPNGGVIDTHFVVSGTYLTSSKQEYALWALDLRTLTWSRIDAGGSVFSQGSWNRGVLWNRRNTFVILGNRKRSLVDDYNHRRINFSNVCMVELEAFGFYDNPRKTSPMSGFISASSPYSGPNLSLTRKAGYTAGGRLHSRASEELGEKALAMRELTDMDILCIGGERIPVNSRIVSRRWGPYFVQLLREGTATRDGSDAVTLRSGLSSNPLRMSALTITPNSRDAAQPPSSSSGGSVLSAGTALSGSTTLAGSPGGAAGQGDDMNPAAVNAAPTPRSLPPGTRPRCLYLPHTHLTVQALLHFLYTSSLPPPSSPLCTPQILCSLLQIARPYRVDGLLEAVVERLHGLLDSRNAAAVFNATAMAAGGGRGIDGSLNPNFSVSGSDPVGSPISVTDFSLGGTTANESAMDLVAATSGLSINTGVPQSVRPSSGEISASTSVSGSEWGSEVGGSDRDHGFIWNGELSSVIGLQKRGLRGLMEGRRMRERTGTGGATPLAHAAGNPAYGAAAQPGPSGQRVGLGIAGS
ncbi:regulatory protein ral2 [Metarhizium album ARSEF 1941]|uniref:Regulatory protein ral2 n=1 Tax=Metarhizium album (strain ARSEF 1941) TaxID=1081103 RepID=A0A0B2WPP6_METAS|nr:regulatory protein ral2 [Metarhizium album ARSEF 1941]KHN95452.1 regulatory protein ral2 [Metarhizium album ARSEF 1941]